MINQRRWLLTSTALPRTWTGPSPSRVATTIGTNDVDIKIHDIAVDTVNQSNTKFYISGSNDARNNVILMMNDNGTVSAQKKDTGSSASAYPGKIAVGASYVIHFVGGNNLRFHLYDKTTLAHVNSYNVSVNFTGNITPVKALYYDGYFYLLGNSSSTTENIILCKVQESSPTTNYIKKLRNSYAESLTPDFATDIGVDMYGNLFMTWNNSHNSWPNYNMLAKLDTNFNEIWRKGLSEGQGSSAYQYRTKKIAVAHNGECYIVSQYGAVNGFYSIAKIDNNGTFVWEKRINTTYDWSDLYVAVNYDNKSVVSGYSYTLSNDGSTWYNDTYKHNVSTGAIDHGNRLYASGPTFLRFNTIAFKGSMLIHGGNAAYHDGTYSYRGAILAKEDNNTARSYEIPSWATFGTSSQSVSLTTSVMGLDTTYAPYLYGVEVTKTIVVNNSGAPSTDTQAASTASGT